MKNLPQKNILKKLINKLSQFDYLIGVILYGSFARAEAGKKSDVDVYILITDSKYKDKIEDLLLEIKSKRVFQPVVRAIDEIEKTEPTFLQNVLREGKVVYWNNLVDIDISSFMRLKPYIIYTFSLKSIRHKTKAKYNYEIYGKKKNGLLYKLKGEFLTNSCVIVPSIAQRKIESLFNRFKVKYKSKFVWY